MCLLCTSTVRAKIRELHFELQKTRAITARYEALVNEQNERDRIANMKRVSPPKHIRFVSNAQAHFMNEPFMCLCRRKRARLLLKAPKPQETARALPRLLATLQRVRRLPRLLATLQRNHKPTQRSATLLPRLRRLCPRGKWRTTTTR